MSDRFTGRWLVSEYVFNPDGAFVGVIHQHRYLEPVANNRLRVRQQMQIDPALAAHPMGRFAGNWTFDLVREGALRQYHGADVVGSGQPYGDSAMLGEGVWPRFGYNFTSFALMLHPQRQVTGGKFYAASQIVATIIGVAHPETHDQPDAWPSFSGPHAAHQVSRSWQGESTLFDAVGQHPLTQSIAHESEVASTYDQYANGQALRVTYTDDGRGALDARGVLTLPDTVEQQPLFGKAKRFGWSIESALYSPQGTRIETMTILDSESSALLSISRWSQGPVLHHVEIKTLRPT